MIKSGKHARRVIVTSGSSKQVGATERRLLPPLVGNTTINGVSPAIIVLITSYFSDLKVTSLWPKAFYKA
jgi:hypothetical protein